ncbi:MAG TPA: hypothetical protein EYP73_01485, partial [Acidimicrobiia bacterium]|nr:hypothetical protein [Acidimicrobiia bacterium]
GEPSDIEPAPLESTEEQDGVGRLTFTVDPLLAPVVAEAEGLEEGDPPRPLGRLQAPDGSASDLVLGELVVTSSDRGLVEDFAARYDGEIVDEFPTDGDRPTDYLVRILPPDADLTVLAERLVALEPEQQGRFAASSGDLLALMAVAAAETGDDLEIGLNWVAKPFAIEDGSAMEAPDRSPRNAFLWPYIASGTAQDIGVDAAWRLLAGSGRLDNRVRILIVDGGFQGNPDLPDAVEMVRGEWGNPHPVGCGKGSDCPWHGTDVALAAVAQLDNEYGAVGPGGPVAELYLFQQYADSWKTLRRVKKVVADKDIDVVNMSYGWDVKVFKSASEKAAQRHLNDMKKAGAIVFAAAGNDGLDIDSSTCIGNACSEISLTIPCETEAAICVGGMGWNTAFKAGGSNYGNDTGNKSVDIYGPYCVFSLNDPDKAYNENATRVACGTSFASPFLAGVAALVKAADPSLTPDQIWAILRDTAHQGGVGFDLVISGNQRRVNAAAAVAKALGVELGAPEVTITKPVDGKKLTINDFPEFAGTATEFTGLPLPILWASDIDGPLSDEPKMGTVATTALSPGVHTITATAVDVRGQVGTAQITVEVVNQPPEVGISWPLPGAKVFEGNDVDPIGQTKDPDTFGPLDDSSVYWQVFRKSDNKFIGGGLGHNESVDANLLEPGSYAVRFVAEDGSITVVATSSFTVLDVPPGESVPFVYIEKPDQDQVFGAGNANPATIEFAGSAFDSQDGQLSGTRLRWVATSEQGSEIVLCRGSSFPADPYPEPETIGDIAIPPQPPKIGVFKSCASFTYDLGLDPTSGTVTT